MNRDDTPVADPSRTAFPSRADARLAASDVTTARVFLDGPGTSYSTADLLRLRGDHAAAQDAVCSDLTIDDPSLSGLVDDVGLFSASTRATELGDYLADPSSGRSFDEESRNRIVRLCPPGIGLQVVLGDGLSPRAVARYGPEMFTLLRLVAGSRGWVVGRPFLVSRCRVGVLNDIGDLLRPDVVVLLIGERPGLQTAESMSAYMAYRPRAGCTDADRNLVCNIHARGTVPADAVARVMDLAEQMRETRISGVDLKERLGTGPPELA